MKPTKSNHMVIIVGAPGSGKTTLAREYQQSGYLVFDNDRVIEATWGKLQFHPSVKSICKKMTISGIQNAIKHGLSFVVTISGATRDERLEFVNMANSAYAVSIVFLDVNKDVCLERCKKDNNRPKSTDWLPIIENWVKRFETVRKTEASEIIVIPNDEYSRQPQ